MAAAVAAMTGDPLIAMHHVLKKSGLAANVDRFITCHSLTSMDGLEYMHHDKTNKIVEMYNDRYRLAAQKM